jgi:hypothetical protein
VDITIVIHHLATREIFRNSIASFISCSYLPFTRGDTAGVFTDPYLSQFFLLAFIYIDRSELHLMGNFPLMKAFHFWKKNLLISSGLVILTILNKMVKNIVCISERNFFAARRPFPVFEFVLSFKTIWVCKNHFRPLFQNILLA